MADIQVMFLPSAFSNTASQNQVVFILKSNQ